MGRPRHNANATGGHGEPAPNFPGYPAPPYPPPPPAGIHDVSPQPQHETEPPAEYYHPPPAPYSVHDVGVQQCYYHEGATTEETQPPAPYPPQEPYAPPAAAAAAADVPHYPPESGTAGAPPVPYPPPQASPLRTPVMGTPVPFPPPGPQQNKDDAGGAAFAYAAGAGEQWSSELFDCDMNQDYAIATAICPCVTFGQIAEIVDEGQTSCLLAGVLYMVMIPALFTCSVLSSSYRQKIRQKYNLVEAPSDDCSVHLINPCCALCQEYRELQSKGFDPSLGWMANLALAQQQQETAMYPPGNQYMSR